jgi:hypothetical protein
MKVDTNTRGNTYWFMFKVSEFQNGAKYKFNIMNFTRNVEKFYSSGMNICTKVEKKVKQEIGASVPEGTTEAADDGPQHEWRYNRCENIVFSP